MTDEQELEAALGRYWEEYHRIFPQGGDAADHDEAHRSAIYAVLFGK